VITVVDPDAARDALLAGRLRCPEPGCDGILRVWSRARARQVRRRDGGLIALRPDRARCRRCAVTQVLLPAWCVPRRGYDVEVVGAALLAAADGVGHRRVAAGVDVPAGTVRGWLRAVRAGAPALTACAVGVAAAAGASVFPAQAPARWAGRALPEAVAALGVAARAFALSLATPRPPGPGGHWSGVDYLAVIAERHRRHLHRGLPLADPGAALAALRGWPLINLLTGGRLLACGPPG
jgi:hypothetical protein